MNAPAHVIAAMRASIEAQQAAAVVDVLPDNWHAVMVFLGMATQWRKSGQHGERFEGLEYGSLAPVLRAKRQVPHAQPMDRLMDQLQVLEIQARDHLNTRH